MSEPLQVSEIFSSIQGEGMLAGRRQIFVRLTGCNLDCRYCDTNFEITDVCRIESEPGSGSIVNLPQPQTLHKVSTVIADWQARLPEAHHSISFTGGEPLLSAASLVEWFPALRRLLPIHLETNGTMHSALMSVVDLVDYISMDIKLPSTSGCSGELWELHRKFLEVAQGCQVSVKIVVGNSTDSAEILKTCDIIEAVCPETPLFLQPLTLPDNRSGISPRHLLRLQALAASRVPNVFVIPQMHKLMAVL